MKERFRSSAGKGRGRRFQAPDSRTENPDRLSPVFSLRHIQQDYCISRCDQDDKAAFADQLALLSKLTWSEIKFAPKHGLGSEKIARSSFKVPIPNDVKEDVTFLAMRYNGRKAMVGFRDRAVFHILWFDRDFTVYDHGS